MLATYEDLCKLPDNVVGELIDGFLYASPRPASRHAFATSALGAVLGTAFGLRGARPGGWCILFEPELRFGSNTLVPDIAGWRRERMPEVPDVAAFELSPDWVCEVLSPSTERLDRARKMAVYSHEGVGHLWLVNPISKTLEVFKRGTPNWVLLVVHGDAERVRAEPFEAIELDLSELWTGAPAA